MDFQLAETLWVRKFPAEMDEVARIEPNTGVRTDGELHEVPWPPLTSEKIIAAKEIAAEWDLHPELVPIMGDFHNLVCLDYRTTEPQVAIVNDDRTEIVRFENARKFLDAIEVIPAKPGRFERRGRRSFGFLGSSGHPTPPQAPTALRRSRRSYRRLPPATRPDALQNHLHWPQGTPKPAHKQLLCEALRTLLVRSL